MRSLESMNRKGHNLDTPKDPEGTINHADAPKSFEEHMQDLEKSRDILDSLLDDLPANDNINNDYAIEHKAEVNAARDAVLSAFEKHGEDDDLISSSINRVFEEKIGPRYDDNPNVFRTDENSVYRITGLSQVADIVNCGHVRSREGKHKGGGTDPIVYWSKGGSRLNYIDERPVIEASATTIRDGQIGAIALDDLSGIWITNPETGQKENRLTDIKDIRKLKSKNAKITIEELAQKLTQKTSILDISESF